MATITDYFSMALAGIAIQAHKGRLLCRIEEAETMT
jgi:hypothetical protein